MCIYATHQENTQHAGCEALSAASLYSDAFASDLELDPNEHKRHTFSKYTGGVYLPGCALQGTYRTIPSVFAPGITLRRNSVSSVGHSYPYPGPL